MCHWHWAKRWIREIDAPVWGINAKGWVIVLDAGASVRKVRAEMPLGEFSPTGD